MSSVVSTNGQLHLCPERSAPRPHESHIRTASRPTSQRPTLLRNAATIGAAWLMLSAAAMQAPPATAGEPAWPTEPYRYTVIDQDLGNVLQEFGRNTGLRLEVSPEIRGRVRGPLPE